MSETPNRDHATTIPVKSTTTTENQLKSASKQSQNSFKQVMAELIIKRVLQKVIIKEQYSK